MGYMNGMIVHLWDAADRRCRPLIVTDDHAPEYNHLMTGLVVSDTTGSPPFAIVRDAPHDIETDGVKEFVTTVGLEPGSWHTMAECPERFNDDNRDGRRGRKPPPRTGDPRRDRE